MIRFLRLVWNQSRLPSKTRLKATAKLISPTMVQLTLKRKMTWCPGQSAILTVPGVSSFPFEAHPFTIASIPQDNDADLTKAISRSENSSQEGDAKVSRDEGNELVFFVKTKEGFTRRLRDLASYGSSDNGIPLPVYVDGPYGSPPDLNAFRTVILIAGGVLFVT
jgi:ferric-chelate reductase